MTAAAAGLKAALALRQLDDALVGPGISPERFYDAVNVVLSYQNHDGGMATYENTRSFYSLEVSLNMRSMLFDFD